MSRNSKEYYHRLKEKGICVRCCKEKADPGHVMCKECLDISRKVSRENFDWFKDHGICYRCGKNKLFGNEKTCPECRAKGIEITNKSRIKNHGSMHNYYINRREQYIAEGRCVRCGKPADKGLKYCRPCLDRESEKKKKQRLRGELRTGIARSERYSYGLCYTCGKPLDTDKRLCASCSAKATERFHGKRGDRTAWKRDNQLIFGGVAHG